MSLERPPRIVAVDYGRKRVGIAVADPMGLFAQPYGTFSPDEAKKVLRTFQEQEGVSVLIIGWPLTMEGEEGEATEMVQGFIDQLQRLLPTIPVVKWDEGYTSVTAEEQIRAAGAKRKIRRDKARVDAAAAAIILQEYLDGKAS